MVKIIGISAGRRRKVTESIVKAMLEGSGVDFELISLSGKTIRPCEACNGCVKTNKCVLKDDFQPIADKLYRADGLVFGAPTYWDHMNAKGQAFWERACFAGRHNALFPLQGKMGVIIGVDGYKGNGEFVIRDVQRFFDDARIYTVSHITAQGEFACFSCGYGNYCPVGGFVELFPSGTPITGEITPSISNQHPEDKELPIKERDITARAAEMGKVLVRAIENRQASQRNLKGWLQDK